MIRREFRHEARILQIPAEHSTMKESPMELALGQMSMENEGRYNQMYRPAFQRYVAGVRDTGTKANINRAAGLATAGLNAEQAPKFNEGMRAASMAGVAPNSGAMMMGMAQGRGALGSGMGNAAFGARMGQRNAYLSGLQNAVGIGKQQSGTAQQSMADVASLAQNRAANDIEMDMRQTGAGAGALMSLAGYGIGQYAGRR